MESPPKRITRARAAAKAGESATKQPTKTVTAAAAKARTARTTTTTTAAGTSTAAKRKTRADENEHEDGSQQPTMAARALRARPRRAAEAAEESSAAGAGAAARARGGPARKTASEASGKDEADEVAASAPARPRGRPRKTPAPEAAEPAKKTTRGRPAAAAKAGTGAATKPPVKKTVKFQEPDKENVEPKAKAKASAPTDLRSRPARRGGAATAPARPGTRAAAAAAAAAGDGGQKKKPLSPKKVTQIPVARDDSSEDELSAEKPRTPAKAMMMTMSPIKPPAGVVASAKKREPARAESELAAAKTGPPPDGAAASSLGSPTRRLPPSPVKESFKTPAKRMGPAAVPGSAAKAPAHHAELAGLKTPLLQSVARRPRSPLKGIGLPPATASCKPLHAQSAIKSKTMFQSPAKRAMPGWRPATEPRRGGVSRLRASPEMPPLVMATPSRPSTGRPSQKAMAEDACSGGGDEDHGSDPPFSGRLSAVLPRHIDPTLYDGAEAMAKGSELEEELMPLTEASVEAADRADRLDEAPLTLAELSGHESVFAAEDDDVDPMALDEIVAAMEESAELPPRSEEPSTQANAMYQLRQKDTDPCHHLQWGSESEDELPARTEDASPTPARAAQTPRAGPGSRKDSRRSTMGLTSLAEQFGSWTTGSPAKPSAGGAAADAAEAASENSETVDDIQGVPEEPLGLVDSPCKGGFFEDEMVVHTDNAPDAEEALGEVGAVETLMDDMMAITEEDVALAQEADDISVMEPSQVYAVVNGLSFDDSLSEASQKYGDENEMPTEVPATQGRSVAPVTPARPQEQPRIWFTTTKVPLKPAESTPSPLKKRSLSASRVPLRRPDGLSRSATVISYSPSKSSGRADGEEPADAWSTEGTPARTPRRNLDPALLRGAVVFVDVHTVEGADASCIFVELLTQMGARCVKAWHWSPSSPGDGEASSDKVGITHVVYKDGDKGTLDKVRRARGLVHCVGVSWVLDCERENLWLDEAPFSIDTSSLPRGGARRRKSMEPAALASLGSPAREASSGAPKTPANRRDSTLWMHTPPSDQNNDEDDWSCALLTPVPKTPAPEAVARYAAELAETPRAGDDDADSSPGERSLVTRTCPPKRSQYRDMGEDILAWDKDEQVLMRLMAARRKSLQFAPKIGSPLSKTWG